MQDCSLKEEDRGTLGSWWWQEYEEEEECHEPIDNARDGLAHVLCGSDDQAAGEQQDRGEDVVETKDCVVRLDLLVLEVIL